MVRVLSPGCLAYAVQLGKAFSSNKSGDEPKEDKSTAECHGCSNTAAIRRCACERVQCYGYTIPCQ